MKCQKKMGAHDTMQFYFDSIAPEQLDLTSQDPSFHTSKPDYNELTHVKVRLLHCEKLPINWNDRRIDPNKKKTKIDRAVIHFHGGGFIAMDSASH